MSALSTPKKPTSLSSASTPSENDVASPPNQLTPRSKLKALLASVDDSDDEPPQSAEGVTLEIPTRANIETIVTRQATGDTGVDTSEDEDNEDVVIPRGRLAARLHGQNATFSNESERDGLDISDANAHEQSEDQQQKLNEFTEQPETNAVSEESEQDIARNRRRGGRPKKSKTSSGSDESPTKIPSTSPEHSLSPTVQTMRVKKNATKEHHSPRLSPPLSSKANTNDSMVSGSDDSDADLPLNPTANARFLELVARKKAERQAKDAAERKGREERLAKLEAQSESRRRKILDEGISEDDSLDEEGVGKKLTQQSRPTRKASKKAIEEMNRETQRMSRNMQLAHQAKTKKKISKDSLLSRFKFRSISNSTNDAIQATSSSIRGSSAPASDAEGLRPKDTPPTSPASPVDELSKSASVDAVPGGEPVVDELGVEDELPSMEAVMSLPLPRPDKGKARAVESSIPEPIVKKSSKGLLNLPAIRIKPPTQAVLRGRSQESESDSDLEIVPVNNCKSKRLAVFDRLPSQKVTEARSLQKLRALAHLTSSDEQGSKTKNSITPSEMQMSLQMRARQQAAMERAEKIQDLKDRGIIIQTAEERERDLVDVEDLLEKARREVEEIRKKEKDAVKKERQRNGEEALDDSSEEDEDYQDIQSEVPEVEVSGSDGEELDEGEEADESSNEDEDGDEDEADDSGGAALHDGIEGLIDDMASEGSEEEEIEEELEAGPRMTRTNRRNRMNRVIDEDDEDNGDDDLKHVETTESLRVPFIPNIHGSNNVPMGLTQAFEATMAESQSQSIDDLGDDGQDSLDFLRNMPAPDFPMFDGEDSVVPNSQPAVSQAVGHEDNELGEISLHLSQSQIDYNPFASATQYSEIPDPTQDTGLKTLSPILNRFVSVPPSTMDTVIIPKDDEDKPIEAQDEPVIKKRGRLRRRLDADLSPNGEHFDGEVANTKENDVEAPANAFDLLNQARRKALRQAPKNSVAVSNPFDEQAEESDDEYAGLGGASDDDSGGEEDEEVRKMIDEGEVKVDERKLAAFFA